MANKRIMTPEEKVLLQAKHRLEEIEARNRKKERNARTRRLIQEGAILESIAFECISESAFEEALEFMGKCEKVYCPLKDFGIMNEKNRELLKKAKETGKLNRIR